MEDLSTVLTSVKPSKRTDQVKILAALYCLSGLSRSATVSDLSDLLSLQLGKKAPKKISTRLREAPKYVRIADKGPPLRWALKVEGLRRLRDVTGLPLPESGDDDDKYKTDIGIVCALEQPEFAAVTEALGSNSWKEIGDARFPHVYRSCELELAGGRKLSVVATTSTSMGLTAASIVTTQLIMQFRPRIVVMIGIAAGTRGGDKEFGDVLVADPSVDYNSGKVVRANGIRGFLPDPYPIGLNPRLRSVLHKYRGRHSIFASIRQAWNGRLPTQPNRLHVGPLGASDQVIDDATRVLEIQQNWRKLIGVEMETYGVYRACHEAPDPKPRFVSFKSVCDFAAEKTDSWQDYAAFTAAKFAVGFLAAEWDALWPANTSTPS